MEHIKRWITALLSLPFVLWIILGGNAILFAALLSLVAVIAMEEYLKIVFAVHHSKVSVVSTTMRITSYAIAMAIIMGGTLGLWQIIVLIIAVTPIILAVSVLLNFSSKTKLLEVIAKQMFGFIYIPVSLCLLIFIRNLPGGQLWILWMLAVIFANDVGAFYVGRYFGKYKLCPNISPNKTVEGAVGGLIGSFLTGFIFSLILFDDLHISFLTLPCSLAMALAGQLGDLFESTMKRTSFIKDSGYLLPGHGGMLDRIDGLLMAVPVLYVYLISVILYE